MAVKFTNLFNKSSLYKNASYLFINYIIVSVSGFIFWNIMARVFSPTEVGIGSALIVATGLLGEISNLGIGIGLMRFLPDTDSDKTTLINSALTIVGVFSTFSALIYIAGIKYWSYALNFLLDRPYMVLIFITFTVFTSMSTILDYSLIAGRASQYVFQKNLIVTLFKLTLPIFVFSFIEGFGIFVGMKAALIIGTIYAWAMFLPRVYENYRFYPTLRSDGLKKLLKYSFANYSANLISSTPSYIYPLMVLNILGAEKSAYFYISWMLPVMLTIIPTSIAQSFFAEASHNPKSLASKGKKALILSLTLSFIAGVSMMFVGVWLLSFFGPNYVANGKEIIITLSIAVIPQCINLFFITINQVKKRVKLILAQTTSFAVLAMGLSYWLLKTVGLVGISAGYTIANFIVSLVVIIPLVLELRKADTEKENAI